MQIFEWINLRILNWKIPWNVPGPVESTCFLCQMKFASFSLNAVQWPLLKQVSNKMILILLKHASTIPRCLQDSNQDHVLAQPEREGVVSAQGRNRLPITRMAESGYYVLVGNGIYIGVDFEDRSGEYKAGKIQWYGGILP